MRNFKSIILSATAIALALTSCAMDKKISQTTSGLNPEKFSATINGKQTSLYSIKNANGMEVCITNFGGRIVSICVPDKNGDMKDVVLGFDSDFTVLVVFRQTIFHIGRHTPHWLSFQATIY